MQNIERRLKHLDLTRQRSQTFIRQVHLMFERLFQKQEFALDHPRAAQSL